MFGGGRGGEQKGGQRDFLEEKVILLHLEKQLKRQLSKERPKGLTCAKVEGPCTALSGNTKVFKYATGCRVGIGGGGRRGLAGGQRPDHEGSCVP